MTNSQQNIDVGGYNTAVYYDAAKRLGLDIGLRGVSPVAPNLRVSAPAFTVKFAPADQPPTNPLNFYDIINAAPKGSVLVFGVGLDRWIFGGNLSLFAQLSGMAGIVMDGCVRDIAEVRERGYPVFTRGTSVSGFSGKLVLSDAGCDITCGDIKIATGDLIVGDDDGVVSLAASRLKEIVYEAEEIAQLDAKLARDIAARCPLAELHATRLRWPTRRAASASTAR